MKLFALNCLSQAEFFVQQHTLKYISIYYQYWFITAYRIFLHNCECFHGYVMAMNKEKKIILKQNYMAALKRNFGNFGSYWYWYCFNLQILFVLNCALYILLYSMLISFLGELNTKYYELYLYILYLRIIICTSCLILKNNFTIPYNQNQITNSAVILSSKKISKQCNK